MKKISILFWVIAVIIFSLNRANKAHCALVAGQDIIPAPTSIIDDPPGAVNDHQQAFDERQGLVLGSPLPVDGGAIPAGTVVDSHMIFLNTQEGSASDPDVRWMFDGLILGVMSDSNGTLEAASSAFLGAAGTVYPPAFANRGMESSDHYSVSADIIKVTMGVGEPGDWIRVITRNSESAVKWDQPPDMEYGVNLQSVESLVGAADDRIVADDWRCTDPRPVTDVHFWGSYIGWRDQTELDGTVTPPGVKEFVIRFYTDIPAGPDPDQYSHPGELLYQETISNFVENFVASIPHFDAAGNLIDYEHKFAYDLDFTQPFIQQEGTVYWISIAAVLSDDPEFPWGWETSDGHWNDNACRFWIANAYWDDINPPDFEIPSWYPHDRTDMAFALTVAEIPPPPTLELVKWQQRPDMKTGVNIKSDPEQMATVADDWFCLDGSPVTDLHFWGSYPGWQPQPGIEISSPGVEVFRIQVYSDAPATWSENFSTPDKLLYETWVEKFKETYVGPIDLPWGEVEHKFRYDIDLPRIFWQKRDRIYWLNISALPKQDYPWGWESSMDRWNDVAVQGWYTDVSSDWWAMLTSPSFSLDFEDLTAGSEYLVGDVFSTSGVLVSVNPFQWSNGTWFSGGSAIVGTAGSAGGTGNEINTNNVNLEFALPVPVTDVSFLFGEYGGNTNLKINGEFINFQDYKEINTEKIGGVDVSVSNGTGNDNGEIKLAGTVNQLATGGQEHSIDEVTFSKFLDMSFDLTTCEGPIKWLQFPDMAHGINIYSSIDRPIVADDFLCTNGRPITEVHFWGSFLDEQENVHWGQDTAKPPFAPAPKIEYFKLSFHSDVPAGADPDMSWSHPGQLLKEVYVDQFTQRYWDSIPHTDAAGHIWWEHKFYFIVELNEDPFPQRKGEVYWLDIGARMADSSDPFHWGWETSKDHWNDIAVLGDGNQWQPLADEAEPLDMAFALITEDDTPYCEGDFNRDGDVDGIDLTVFAGDMLRTDCFDTGDCEGDFDYDGDVDSDDLALFSSDYGRQDCPCTMPEDCDDGNPCTEDFLDPVTLQCVHEDKVCNDSNSCTDDECHPETGECVYTPRNCDDGIECTNDECDPAEGCVYIPEDNLCDDNDPCTIDICDPPGGCFHQEIPNCIQACCLPAGTCEDLSTLICEERGGQAMGAGSDCTNTPCRAVEHDTLSYSPIRQVTLTSPDGRHELIDVTGPMEMDVYFEGPREGDAQDDDGDNLDEVEIEIISLNLSGSSSAHGTIKLKTNAAFPSIGGIEETTNPLPGRLDLPPFGNGGSPANSFFDVFVEVEIGGQTHRATAPLRFTGRITHKPPVQEDTVTCIPAQQVELFDENEKPSGFFLGCGENP